MIDENEQLTSPNADLDWVFPDVDNFEETFLSEYQTDGGKKGPDALQMEKDAYAALSAELEKKKAEYDDKMAVLNGVLAQVSGAAARIDGSVVDIVSDIINKIVKKIIYREIDADPRLINKMIDELKKILQARKSLVTVYLSEEDFKNFSPDEGKSSTVVSMDPALDKGDIIIKSNNAEIRALLAERIEKLMK